VINSPRPPDVRPFRVALACGFTPLHFETFLAAHNSLIHADRAVSITHGLYGDLAGNLERLNPSQADAAVAPMEWPDLDARLGIRSAGGWDPETLPDILRTARLQLERIAAALKRITSIPLVVSLPALPLPPVFYTNPSRLSLFEAELRSEVAAFSNSIACPQNICVIASGALDRASPPGRRFDIKSELRTGFPYTLDHAEALARLLAAATRTPVRKKGLITDLDDTLWRGVLGEIGAAGVCWTLDRNAPVHGLYQQFLASLAASGTLVAVASKNDPGLVAEAFEREDLLLPKDRIFPVEAHWGPKSQSVARILAAWNIGAESVVFIDDSPMELAEARAAFPTLECVQFPKDDPEKVWELLFELREKFGTAQILREDALRSASLRARARSEAERQVAPAADMDAFLRGAESEIAFASDKDPDARVFELINKTNQFNLNGARISEADWNALLADPRRFVLKVSYKDRYGALGTIAALAGAATGGNVAIDYWVMSCRAFSRRIEHRCLEWIFQRFHAEEVTLHFASTPRNRPAREFLAGFLGAPPEEEVRLSKALFEEKCPPLYHSIREIAQ